MTGQLELYRLTFLVLAGLGLAIGAQGLMRVRPLILRSSWSLILVLLVSVPHLLAILLGWPARDPRLGLEVELLTCALMASPAWVGLRGYVLLGVTPTTLKSALKHALTQLGLNYEQRGSSFVIQSEGLELETSVQSLIGTAKLHARETWGQHRLADVTAEMEAYFTTHPVETNRTIYGYCIIAGASLLAVAIVLMFARPAWAP